MPISFDAAILPNKPILDCLQMGQAAEKLGYGGIWVADSHSVMRDAFGLLAALAMTTDRIKLATGVTQTVTRHPAVLANSWASLQELSGGRGILGIGVGESAVYNLGLKPEKLADFEEKIRVIRALIKGQSVSYQGTDIQMAWSQMDIPIVMACSGPRSLQLGGRLTDGVLFQVGSNPDFVRYALDNIRLGAEQAGRDINDLKLYMRVACAISENREQARDEVKGYASVAAGTTFKTVPKEYFDEALWDQLDCFKAAYDYAEHGSNEARHKALLTDDIIDSIAIAGTPEEAIPRFKEIVEMGVDGFVMPFGMADPYPYMKSFAEQVIPKFAEY